MVFELEEFIDFITEKDSTPTHIAKVFGIIWNHDNDTLAVPRPPRV